MSESHIACPHCHAINRLPESRLLEGPKCGQCHAPLFTGQPVELTASNFSAHAQRGEIPLLVDFWAPWCGPCRMMAPQFVAAAALLEPHLRLGKLNTENEPGLAAQYAIRSIPTMVMFHRGRELARHSGAIGSAEIVRWAQSQLQSQAQAG